jgi:hypothetical protein
MVCFRVPAVALAVALGWANSAAAGPMLTGSVRYDPGTRLYTYSYVLDDRAAAGPVSHVYVRVLDGFNGALAPADFAAPAPYGFGTYTGHSLIGHPDFVGGTFFGWTVGGAAPPVEVGVKGGFSFTTGFAPTTGRADNYYLWSTAATAPPGQLADGVQDVGYVVAPDFSRPATAPEPGSLAIAALGLVGVGLRAGWGRFRRAQASAARSE